MDKSLKITLDMNISIVYVWCKRVSMGEGTRNYKKNLKNNKVVVKPQRKQNTVHCKHSKEDKR